MSTLWIRQYSNVGDSPGTSVQVAEEPGIDLAALTYSTTATSAAFGDNTVLITIISDAAFHYVVGPAATATTAALKIPANTLWSVAVTPGHKIAAVAAA